MKAAASVVSRFEGEAPYVAQSHGRPRRSEYHTQFAPEVSSFILCHKAWIFLTIRYYWLSKAANIENVPYFCAQIVNYFGICCTISRNIPYRLP